MGAPTQALRDWNHDGRGGRPVRDHPSGRLRAPWVALVIAVGAGLICYGAVQLKDGCTTTTTSTSSAYTWSAPSPVSSLPGVFASLAFNAAGANGRRMQLGR
jgi:hypothetical protein